MNIIDIIQDAAAKVNELRHPDLSEFIAVIDPILAAYNESTIGNDTVESITVTDSYLYITTSYSVRGCGDQNDIRVPMSILEADDPIKAAKTLKVKHEIHEYERKIAHEESMLVMHRAKLEKLQTELKELA